MVTKEACKVLNVNKSVSCFYSKTELPIKSYLTGCCCCHSYFHTASLYPTCNHMTVNESQHRWMRKANVGLELLTDNEHHMMHAFPLLPAFPMFIL